MCGLLNLSALIFGGDEWKFCQPHWHALATEFGEERCIGGSSGGSHVTHCNRRIDARTKPAGSDDSDRIGRCIVRKQPRPVPDRRAPLRTQANAPTRRAIFELIENPVGARETAWASTVGSAAC